MEMEESQVEWSGFPLMVSELEEGASASAVAHFRLIKVASRSIFQFRGDCTDTTPIYHIALGGIDLRYCIKRHIELAIAAKVSSFGDILRCPQIAKLGPETKPNVRLIYAVFLDSWIPGGKFRWQGGAQTKPSPEKLPKHL